MLNTREFATDSNKAPVIRAVAALLMVISVLSTTIHLTIRYLTMRAWHVDDALVAGATVFAISQSIAVISAGANGLGKYKVDLDSSEGTVILKAIYAADLLFIAGSLLTKVSATRTLLQMAPRNRRILITCIEVSSMCWAASSIITILFQCRMPEPWNLHQEQCIHRTTFWSYVDVVYILSDAAIVCVTTEIFRNIQTSRSKKALVIGVFGSRVCVIPAVASHLYFLKIAETSRDLTFAMWRPYILLAVVQCLAILTTCIPHLKPFLDSLESGQMIAGDIRQTRSKGSSGRSKSGPYSGAAKRHHGTTKTPTSAADPITSASAERSAERCKMYEMENLESHHAEAATATAVYEPSSSWDGQSHTSQTVLVHQTWRVEVESKSAAGNF